MYCATTGYTCKILYGTRTLPHNQALQTYTISVCAYVGVLYSLEILPQACIVHVRSTYKVDFLFSNLCCGVLHSQKCYVMSQCYLTYTCTCTAVDRATDLISVALFNQVTFFLILTIYRYFNCLVQGLLPIAVMPFTY